jgi:hypothetical protein
MRISKLKLFVIINGSIAAGLVCYFSLWFLSPTVTAKMVSPFYANTVTVKYLVDGNEYSGEYMRNDLSFSARTVRISYLSMDPELSRVRSFMGICMEPLAWWLVFLLASSMLLLTDNLVFSKGTVFVFQKKFPWVSMEEFYAFPFAPDEEQQGRSTPASVKKQRLIGRQ